MFCDGQAPRVFIALVCEIRCYLGALSPLDQHTEVVEDAEAWDGSQRSRGGEFHTGAEGSFGAREVDGLDSRNLASGSVLRKEEVRMPMMTILPALFPCGKNATSYDGEFFVRPIPLRVPFQPFRLKFQMTRD